MARRRRHHYRRSQQEPAELNITTFLNLMVVLVPFLLITAVFSRITIVELSLPAGADGSDNQQPLMIEIIVRETGIEISDSIQILSQFPVLKEADIGDVFDEEGIRDTTKFYELKKVSQFLVKIKEQNPNKMDAVILVEPNIEYRLLIHVMDAVRSTFVLQPSEDGGADVLQQVVLFPDISIGDAP